LEIRIGRLHSGETYKSIKSHSISTTRQWLNGLLVEQWELPYLEINPKTNCFEPTGETYKHWGVTEMTRDGSRTCYFQTLANAEIFAITREIK